MATFKEYIDEKVVFSQKHNKKGECKVYTSPMVNNGYHKEIVWDDGHMWCEVTELVTEDVEVEIHGLKTWTTIELWKTEYWTTESKSKYLWEKA